MLDVNNQNGVLFNNDLMKEIKDKFYDVDYDPCTKTNRVFMDNAGGAFRLKKVLESYTKIDELPDCPERKHPTALYLQDIMAKGEKDIRTIFNAHDGEIETVLTASQAIWDMVGTIAENVPGTNIITTVLEHPSSFDACAFYAKKTGKELRVAKSNPKTGGIDADEIIKLVDKDTCLLNFMYASNISGAIMDAAEIVKRAREIKPDLYITIDAVQHVPHGVVDVDSLKIDGMNFAPYKFFGNRGSGIAYISPRLAVLPHHELLAKDHPTWQLGSPAPSQFIAISEIVNYVCWLGQHFETSSDRRTQFISGMNAIKLHERALMNRMLDGTSETAGLRNIPGVKVYLDYHDMTKRDFIIAVGFDKVNPTEAVLEYAKRNVTVYDRLNTSLYSKRMLDSFGMTGCIRVSPLHCQDIHDIDTFLKATKEISELSH